MAGIRKQSADIQAIGSPQHTPKKPVAGTIQILTHTRAIISKTPEFNASLVNPTPCNVYLRVVRIPRKI